MTLQHDEEVYLIHFKANHLCIHTNLNVYEIDINRKLTPEEFLQIQSKDFSIL